MQSRVDRTWTAHTRGSELQEHHEAPLARHTCGTGASERGLGAPAPAAGAPLVPETAGPDKEVASMELSRPSPFSEYILPGSWRTGNVAP